MKIAITGATGLIGRRLTHALMLEGHQIIALTRSPDKLPEIPIENIYNWSDQQPPPMDALKNCDAVIHLAGEGIADKLWTQERKKKLRDSRIIGTRNIAQTLASLPPEQRPKIFLSGSAIGIYNQSSETQDENSSLGSDFLAELCKDWETEAKACEKLGIRTVLLRTGLVLARNGGLLSKSGPVVLGDGNQWMSWIHIDDVIQLILFSLNNNKIRGPINLTAKNPVTNKEFTESLNKVKKIPFKLFAPKIVLKLALGELSQAVLSNQKVVPTKALANGFKFKYENLDAALEDLVGNLSFNENLFTVRQFVPAPKKEVFSFFSKAENLETLTPPWLNFHIVGKSTPEIKKETLIDYKLKIHGVPIKWKTLIKEWSPDNTFVDLQLKGPYRKWHHLHSFDEVPGGTLISDEVTFEVPGWIFGKIFLPFVKKDIQGIFNYRQKKIKELSIEGKIK